MNDLHAAIMNLPDKVFGNDDFCRGFRAGHRAARHDAAELAAADAAVKAELLEALKELAENAHEIEYDCYSLQGHEEFKPRESVMRALALIAKHGASS